MTPLTTLSVDEGLVNPSAGMLGPARTDDPRQDVMHMPVIQCDIREGRTPEQKQAMAAAITAALLRIRAV